MFAENEPREKEDLCSHAMYNKPDLSGEQADAQAARDRHYEEPRVEEGVA
jgi:hypothetical protein